jgi:uncharacterized protein (DUF58 family)
VRRVNIGWGLGGWLLVSLLIALDRGIDLLWALVMLLASVLMTALWLPYWQVRRVSIERRVPEAGACGESLQLEYEIAVKGLFPCFGVELHDRVGENNDLMPVAYFRVLRGRSLHQLRWTPTVRGPRQFDDVLVQSRFPLGLACATRRLSTGAHRMIVYPGFARWKQTAIETSTEPHLEHLVGGRRGGRDEFFGARQYVPGSDPRAVNWRATARTGQLVVREFERPPERRLWIVLELASGVHTGYGAASTHESMFRIAHSVVQRATRNGIATGLLWREGGDLRRLEPSTLAGGEALLRQALASVPVAPILPVNLWLSRCQSRLPRGGQWLVFNLAGPTFRGPLIQVARHCDAQPVIIEFDLESFGAGEAGVRESRIKTFRYGDVQTHVIPCDADITGLFAPAP